VLSSSGTNKRNQRCDELGYRAEFVCRQESVSKILGRFADQLRRRWALRGVQPPPSAAINPPLAVICWIPMECWILYRNLAFLLKHEVSWTCRVTAWPRCLSFVVQ